MLEGINPTPNSRRYKSLQRSWTRQPQRCHRFHGAGVTLVAEQLVGHSPVANIKGTPRRVERYRARPHLSRAEVEMAKGEQTSKKAGTAASKVLKSGSTGKNSKTAAGSALTQRPTKKK
jgi:hypothetical protein